MPSKSQSILLGTAVYVVVSLILQFIGQGMGGGAATMVVGALGCLIALAIGAVPVWHYTSTHNLTVPAGTGAGMGAISLVLGAILLSLVTWLLVSAGVMPDPQEIALEQMEREGMPQEQIDLAMQFANPLISAAIGAVLGAILGAIGGAIGASMFKKGTEPPAV